MRAIATMTRVTCAAFAVSASIACGGGSPKAKAPEASGDEGDAGEVATSVSGESAPVANAEQVVGAMKNDLRKCFTDAGDPKLQGAVMIEAKIDPSGAVTSASPKGTTALPPAVVDCIVKRVQLGKFAPPGPTGSTLDIPLSFKAGQ